MKSLRKQLQKSGGTYAATPSNSEDDNKCAYVTAGLGYRFNKNWRGEFTYIANVAENKDASKSDSWGNW